MKKLTSIIAIAFLMTLGFNAVAQKTSTAQADATATIITPLKIEKLTDLNFGKIVPNAAQNGTVTIAPLTGAPSYTNGVTTIAGNSTSSATFTLTGNAGTAFTLTLPADGAIKLEGPEGSIDMPIKSFLSNLGGTGSYSLPSATQTLYVGATLDVDKDQENGLYVGSFEVTVAYN